MTHPNTEQLDQKRARGFGGGGKSITARAKDGPFGKTFLYERIKDGTLKARKAGRATIILDGDWADFLSSLPIIGVKEVA